jgi:GDP-4-dehydro-6-deoxy-D-mannose reductase
MREPVAWGSGANHAAGLVSRSKGVMRILVTGALGFVGRRLVLALRRQLPPDASITPASSRCENDPDLGRVALLDVTRRDAVGRIVQEFAPTHVVHLAGVSAPLRIKEDPLGAWTANVIGTLNLAHAILHCLPSCRLIFAGSGLVYGGCAPGRAFDELSPLAPVNEYAAMKAAADLALGALAMRGLNVVRLRLFNHTGPGQTEAFVVPGFAAQIARIEAGLQPPVISVGNLDAVRDFLDVDDVVAAYVEVVLRAGALPAGQVLNIASGVPRRIGSVLDGLLALCAVPITVQTEPGRVQSGETPYSVGDASAARRVLNWAPGADLRPTLAGVLSYWRGRLAQPTDA